jgi:hypothetical protein
MRALVTVVATLAASGIAFADEVHLRNGRTITGCAVVMKGEKVIVEVGSGTITLAAKDVESVKESDCPLKQYPGRLAAIKESGKAADFYDLAKWCRENRISKHVEGLLKKVIEIDPNHEAARKELGFVKHEGKWLTHDEHMASLGKVKFEGRWMSPIDVELIKAKRLAEEEKRLEAKLERERRAREESEARELARQEMMDRIAEMQRAQEMQRRYRRSWYVPAFGRWGGAFAMDTFDVVGFLQAKGFLPK